MKKPEKKHRKNRPEGTEGVSVAETANVDGISESFTKMGEAFLSMDARKVAALYIEFVENLTKQFLDFQEAALGWAKATPLAPFVEFQTSIARKLAETSINAARNLWQIQTEPS
jgi:hypothetical protein